MKRENDYQWIVEDLMDLPSFIQVKMMGCELISLDGKRRLVLADKDIPWNGLLICTSHEFHESLMRDVPSLQPHPVLKKWLYLSPEESDFEGIAQIILKLVLKGDPRIGVDPKPKKKKVKKKIIKKAPAKKSKTTKRAMR